MQTDDRIANPSGKRTRFASGGELQPTDWKMALKLVSDRCVKSSRVECARDRLLQQRRAEQTLVSISVLPALER